MPKMRIVMPFARKDGGGSVVSGALFAKMLADLGHQVTAVVPTSGYVDETFAKNGIAVDVLDSHESSVSGANPLKWLSNNIRLLNAARSYLKRNAVDVVHINDDTTLLGWAVAARIRGLKVVWHVRQGHSGKQDRLRAWLCDASIAISDYVLNRTQSLLPSKRIYNPVEHVPEYFTHRVQQPFTLLFVGRPVSYKRVEWALASLAEILKVHGGDSAVLQIAGAWSDSQQAELIQGLADDVRAQVRFLGHSADLTDFYRNSDLLLHPALNEAFGRVLIEAQAHSLPVVTTRSGGAKEIVSHGVNGIAVEPDDKAGYIRSVLELMSSPEQRHQLATQAHQGVYQNFSMDACSKQLKIFYETHI